MMATMIKAMTYSRTVAMMQAALVPQRSLPSWLQPEFAQVCSLLARLGGGRVAPTLQPVTLTAGLRDHKGAKNALLAFRLSEVGHAVLDAAGQPKLVRALVYLAILALCADGNVNQHQPRSRGFVQFRPVKGRFLGCHVVLSVGSPCLLARLTNTMLPAPCGQQWSLMASDQP